MMVILNSILLFIIGGIVLVLRQLKKVYLVDYLAVPYFFMNAIATACCYKGWVPNSFSKYSNDVM